MEKINLLMFIGYIGLVCGGVCVRKSPELMKRIAAWLLASAIADDMDRDNRQKLHTQYKANFKVAEKKQARVVSITEEA